MTRKIVVLPGDGIGPEVTAVALQGQPGLLGGLGRLGGVVGGLLGIPLAGYTAVLLSTTSVPFWQATRRSLPLLFLATSAASAASLLELRPQRARATVHVPAERTPGPFERTGVRPRARA